MALIQVLQNSNEDPELRNSTVSALGNIGRSQSITEAFPALNAILKDKTELKRLREAIPSAIDMVRDPPQSTVEAVIDIVNDRGEDPQLRRAAAITLGFMPPGFRTASVLASVLRDKGQDAGLRFTAADTLGRT